MKRLLREPLLHFLLFGALLFGAYAYVDRGRGAFEQPKQIQLSIDELTQMTLLFRSQWRREPTTAELSRMVENKIEQEILYREALAMGLDKDDEIVKRRMAQKMQFLAEDLGAAREPTTDELREWFGRNSDKFAEPPRLSFRHLYFSPDRRGTRARDDAMNALERIADEPQDSQQAATLADRFMFQEYYRDRPTEFLGKEFGPQFAVAVSKLPPGSWHGPIESGFGWHLVFVDTVIPGRVPVFEEIEADVKTAWLAGQKARAWQAAYKDMRAKYTVLLPVPPKDDATPRALVAPLEGASSRGERS